MRELLEIGKRGMFANQRSLDVIGQNIANANTPGYSRQRVDLEPLEFKRNGISTGLGVNVVRVQQLRDAIVDEHIRQKEGDLGAFNEQAKIYEALEVLFSSGADNDIDKLITKFFNSFSELSNNPESLALRQNVLNASQNVAGRLNDLSASMDQITNDLVKDASLVTKEINRLTADIAKLNVSISTAASSGQPDNKSLDIRNQRLDELAKYVDVNVTYDNNGSSEVRIGNIVVVNHDKASVIEPEFDSVNNKFRLRLNNGRTVKNVGGKLGASIDSYETILPNFRKKLDDLASNLVTQVNNLHVNGYDLNGNTGQGLFLPSGTKASSIQVNTVIANDVTRIAASDTNGAVGNNNVAISISNLLNSSNAISGKSFIEYALSISSETGFALTGLRTKIESTESTRLLLKNQQEAVSGVNMDEELANMIKFQNAYQASARVISSVQQMYDTLLSLV